MSVHAPRAARFREALRLGLVTACRLGLPSDEPEVARLVSGLTWHIEALMSQGRTRLMEDALRERFGMSEAAARAAAREAWDVWMQQRVEDALLPRMSHLPDWVDQVGEPPGVGVLWHYEAGNVGMAAWALGVRGHRVVRVMRGERQSPWPRWHRRLDARAPWATVRDLSLPEVEALAHEALVLVPLEGGLRPVGPAWTLTVRRQRNKRHLVEVTWSADPEGALSRWLAAYPGHYAMTLAAAEMP